MLELVLAVGGYFAPACILLRVSHLQQLILNLKCRPSLLSIFGVPVCTITINITDRIQPQLDVLYYFSIYNTYLAICK